MPRLLRSWRLPIAARFTPESALLPDGKAVIDVQRRLGRARIGELGVLGWLSWNPVLIPLAIGCYVVLDRFVVPPILAALPFGMPFPIDLVASSLLTVIPILLLAAVLQRRAAERVIREVLLERGVPVCRRCGHALHGLSNETTRCPECGVALAKDQLALVRAIANSSEPRDTPSVSPAREGQRP